MKRLLIYKPRTLETREPRLRNQEGTKQRPKLQEQLDTNKHIEEVIDKELRDRGNEENERQNRRNNIIVFGLLESKVVENE